MDTAASTAKMVDCHWLRTETTGYEYSPGGRVDKRLLANGCVTSYGYDEAGRVKLVDNRAPDLSVISSFEYERDSRGNPTSITREDGSLVEYGYDAKSQLTSEVHKDPLGATVYAWEWDYDLCGNRTYRIYNGVRTDYTYNAANQLTEETTAGVTTHYTYDRCGNTKSKQESAGTTHYHWDHENRLVQLDQPVDVHSYFGYDADGKRVSKLWPARKATLRMVDVHINLCSHDKDCYPDIAWHSTALPRTAASEGHPQP